tara:strand:+ start:1894 stop:2511 length:618 start_codon:yes stop_codon:yes gene_type:complete
MQIKTDYLVASFFSFLIHAIMILYLMDFFYAEKQYRPVLSKPVSVNLLFEDEIKKMIKTNSIKPIVKDKKIELIKSSITDKKIQFTPVIQSTDIKDLIKEDNLISMSSEQNLIDQFSGMIIQFIQSAWIKPQNIQDGLICELRMSINKNGRIIDIDLIKSSGNIRFDNSAIIAVKRIETFNFFNQISYNLYQNNFRNVVITFNPS